MIEIGPSLMTSVSKLRDERDTPKRRRRHRDGGLLRGGIGLTTGLGWSDRFFSFLSFLICFHSSSFQLSAKMKTPHRPSLDGYPPSTSLAVLQGPLSDQSPVVIASQSLSTVWAIATVADTDRKMPASMNLVSRVGVRSPQRRPRSK